MPEPSFQNYFRFLYFPCWNLNYGKDSYKGKGVKTNSGKEYNNYDQWTLNHIITYDNSFGDHNLVVDLVGEMQSRRYDKGTLSGDNQPVEYTSYHNLGSN